MYMYKHWYQVRFFQWILFQNVSNGVFQYFVARVNFCKRTCFLKFFTKKKMKQEKNRKSDEIQRLTEIAKVRQPIN